jgi:glycosyltransferase involved in cell wall biosynthesis
MCLEANDMTQRLPITAIVIYRNEAKLLEGCLSALRPWCEELITVDMDSRDGSNAVAARYADRMFRGPAQPVAEPTRVAAARHARHDWVLLIDPDEYIPPALWPQIEHMLRQHPQAGAVNLPLWYYFKRKRLTGTIWGSDQVTKRRLIHRARCLILPYCNRLTEMRPGCAEVTIAGTPANHIRHYWSDSYHQLLWRHLSRYCHTEAKALAATGARFTLRRGLLHPLEELNRCLRHYDGWRCGLRGWLLSGIYFAYTVLSDWLLWWYQGRVPSAPEAMPIPELEEVGAQDEQKGAQALPPAEERKAA